MLRYHGSLQATPPSPISRPDICSAPHLSFGIFVRTNAAPHKISGHKKRVSNRLVNRQEETNKFRLKWFGFSAECVSNRSYIVKFQPRQSERQNCTVLGQLDECGAYCSGNSAVVDFAHEKEESNPQKEIKDREEARQKVVEGHEDQGDCEDRSRQQSSSQEIFQETGATEKAGSRRR